jgi:hypothetical protein
MASARIDPLPACAYLSRCQRITDLPCMPATDDAPNPKLVRAVWLVAIMGLGAVL